MAETFITANLEDVVNSYANLEAILTPLSDGTIVNRLDSIISALGGGSSSDEDIALIISDLSDLSDYVKGLNIDTDLLAIKSNLDAVKTNLEAMQTEINTVQEEVVKNQAQITELVTKIETMDTSLSEDIAEIKDSSSGMDSLTNDTAEIKDATLITNTNVVNIKEATAKVGNTDDTGGSASAGTIMAKLNALISTYIYNSDISASIDSKLDAINNALTLDCNKIEADDALLLTLLNNEVSTGSSDTGTYNYVDCGSFYSTLPGSIRFDVRVRTSTHSGSATVKVTIESESSEIFSAYGSVTHDSDYQVLTFDADIVADTKYTIKVHINGDAGWRNTVFVNLAEIRGRYTRDSVEYIYTV